MKNPQTGPLPSLNEIGVNARLIKLYDIVRSLNSIIELDHLLVCIVASAAEMLDAYGGAVLLLDDDGQNLIFKAAAGGAAPDLKGIKVPVNAKSIAGCVALYGNSIIENDAQHSPFFSGQVDKETRYTTRQIVCVPLKLHRSIIGVVEVINKVGSDKFEQEDVYLLEALADVAAVAIQNSRLYEAQLEKSRQLEQLYVSLQQTHDATMQVLAGMLDMRDDITHGHSNRVVAYTLKLAEVMGMTDPDELRALEHGALLHDVGKIGVSDLVLQKPARLTGEEWVEMKKHPEMGYRLLRNIEFLQETLPTVRHHHEHWDGTGYPGGLKGTDIPFQARLFAVADAYDAITSDRPYSRARTYDEAAAILREESGRTFDPAVVEAFLSVGKDEWQHLRFSAMSKLTYISSDDEVVAN